jgi:putative chitinase
MRSITVIHDLDVEDSCTRPQDAPVLRPVSSVPVPHTASSRKQFFDKYRSEFGSLTPDAEPALMQLFDLIEQEKNIQDVRHVAYILATIYSEAGGTFRPSTEYGADDKLEQTYGPGMSAGKELGNAEPGDGYRYKGRGYVLNTGKRNYQKMNEALGLANTNNDLVKYPEKSLIPVIAYRILSHGMQNGAWTGRKLSDFIDGNKTDYVGARHIIGVSYHADLIANNAMKFETILRYSLALSKSN